MRQKKKEKRKNPVRNKNPLTPLNNFPHDGIKLEEINDGNFLKTDILSNALRNV